jgi:hypothetical protein
MQGREQHNSFNPVTFQTGMRLTLQRTGLGLLSGIASIVTLATLLPNPTLHAQTPSSSPAIGRLSANKCDFSRPVPLLRSSRYGMLGDDRFDTLVCGYLVTKQEEVFGEPMMTAYLRIVRFQDPGFQRALAQQVEGGNSVNIIKNGVYDFNLGCFQNRQIVGMNHDPKRPYLMPAVQNQLLASTATNPVALILSFGKHTGGGCECCNTAHQIRLY